MGRVCLPTMCDGGQEALRLPVSNVSRAFNTFLSLAKEGDVWREEEPG